MPMADNEDLGEFGQHAQHFPHGRNARYKCDFPETKRNWNTERDSRAQNLAAQLTNWKNSLGFPLVQRRLHC